MVLPMVSAEGEINAGITPDSILYDLDVFFDDLRLQIQTNSEERANVGLDIAEERIAEIKIMSEENKIEAMERAIEQHQKQTQQIENSEVGEQLREQIRERLRIHTQTLEQIRDNAPEEAYQGLNTAIQSSNKARNNIGV